ncbi:MAG TPA: hypothetical protein VGA92_06035 [Candidatus Nitrosotenuis sp.]
MKKIILGLIIVTLFSTTSTVFAQEVNFGQPAVQSVQITINEDSSAHVVHIVEPSGNSRQLSVISNDFINLQITDQDGDSVEYGEIGGDRTAFLILPTKKKVNVEYDLADVISEKNGMMTWDYHYLASTSFYLPTKADLVFVNGNPINLSDLDGIRCHGCQVILEYQLDKTETVEQVQWEDKKFDVRIITNTDISSFEFDQPNKKISFDVSDANQYITLIIPLELLWNPYEVFLNENKMLKHEFYSDEKNVWLNIKTNETGTVEIIGVSAVPEFPFAAVLILATAMIFAARYTNNFNLR